MRCKSLLLATVSSLAIIGAVNVAVAADLPARVTPVPVKAPVIAAARSWTGFYIGVHGGGAWLDHKQTTTFNGIGVCSVAPGPDCSLDKFGGAFGGLAGYNFQSGQIVYGIEVDASWLNLKGSKIVPSVPLVINPLTIQSKVNWIATVRGRLGIAINPLFYVTGGAAFAETESSWADSGGNAVSVSKTKTGWVAGGGIEHAFAPNWLVRVEGLYHDLGKTTGAVAGFGATYNTTFRHRVSTVRGAVALRW